MACCLYGCIEACHSAPDYQHIGKDVGRGMAIKGDEIFFWLCMFFHGTNSITELGAVQALINCFSKESDVS
jgi:hypothetical protein